MTKFDFSIITPVFNREDSLQRCIDSVISQSFDNYELILINDGSTDRSIDIINNARRLDPRRIVFINNVINRGVNFARNRGIKVARGKFIIFLDSDDYFNDGILGRIKEILDIHHDTRHFLFLISTRIKYFIDENVKNVYYSDWLLGNLTGDFTHVVSSEILKENLFFEQFRMFEYLNWLRVKKITSPQLLVPIETTVVEPGRGDSLISQMTLRSASSLISKFNSEALFFELYHVDLASISPRSLRQRLLKTVILGVACNKKSKCKMILKYADNYLIKLTGQVFILFPPLLVQFVIVRFSLMQSRIFRNTKK